MTGAFRVYRIELERIFTLRPAFAVLVIAVLIYSVFYPQPYRNEALRDVPIALVDQDDTDSSRQLARRLDASSDIAIAATLPDEVSAEREIFARNLYGLVIIPKYFERDLLHGRASPIALYADASYFLIYQRISGAVTAVARTMGAEVETARLIAAHVDPAIAAAVPDPLPLTAVTLFNPQGGYATYILPAAFVLILQQTLLIGVGLLGTHANPKLEELSPAQAGPYDRVLGKLLAYMTLQLFAVSFYLIALPYLYGLPRLGSPMAIAALAIPFVIAVSSLGMVIARLVRNPLAVQLLTAAVGIPFLFLAGFSWPSEAIPAWLKAAALALPSTSAINGLVAVAQLGATVADVRQQFLTLSALAGVYTVFAFFLEPRGYVTRKAILAR
ncbi:ABC transporter permease [Rhizobium jaguaris]|uniref:ABC transporter permease n=1 Tax=Rhizobium jaguaris TaxID=1312183 RepID=A0A387FJX5_9HYPH|nr:ABC transporter permease [Rhizobium jaguaris]AYG59670.1 ABC transporter permease [Rhizobium jaguaris]